jgi:hypothetical protein
MRILGPQDLPFWTNYIGILNLSNLDKFRALKLFGSGKRVKRPTISPIWRIVEPLKTPN